MYVCVSVSVCVREEDVHEKRRKIMQNEEEKVSKKKRKDREKARTRKGRKKEGD